VLLGSGTPPAHSQLYFAEDSKPTAIALQRAEDGSRFTLSAYYAQWQNPYRFRVTIVDPVTSVSTTRSVRLVADTSSSPLVEAGYRPARRWRIGFWYNPVRGERLTEQIRVGGTPVDLNLERDADLADLHVVYTTPTGTSVQLGYYWESFTARLVGSDLPPQKDTFSSWNLWLAQQFSVPVQRYTLIPFFSVGYHTSDALNQAVSLQAGATFSLQRHFDLSGSIWLFDLSNTARRITGGLVYWF
jgi:hypothetical protein